MQMNQVSKMVNLPISTIRYYEKMNIIPSEYIVRDKHNYRHFEPGIIEHLNVVKACLTVGFSINEIKSMILMNGFSKESQNSILKDKISELENAQRKLEGSKQQLQTLLASNTICEHGFGKTNEREG